MNTKSNRPQAMLEFFRAKDFPIQLTIDNAKTQTQKNWNYYMRWYWVKDRFIEPHHPYQNTFE